MPLKNGPYTVPEQLRIRLIIDTDCACEADDQFAIAHALMTPQFDVKAICAEHFGTIKGRFRVSETADKSYQEILRILSLMGLENEIPVLPGCKDQLPDEKHFVDSPASRYIVEEALKEDARPLFVINIGAVTNLASACLMNPAISDKLTAVWIGGGVYPEGGWEFNLCNDIAAANVLMNSSIRLWQIPMNVYSLMRVSLATLYEKVYPCGSIGHYLFDHVVKTQIAMADLIPRGEYWCLGDSPAIGVLMDEHLHHYTVEDAPAIEYETGRYLKQEKSAKKIRIYQYVDSQFILEDFFAKIKYQFQG